MKRKNPAFDPEDVPQGVFEAADLAERWHGGQMSPLYKLSCGQWRHLTAQDYFEALLQFRAVIKEAESRGWPGESSDDYDALHDAVHALERWVAKLEEHEGSAERNPRQGPLGPIHIQGTYYIGESGGWAVAPFSKAYTIRDAKVLVDDFFKTNSHGKHATDAEVEIWSDYGGNIYELSIRDGVSSGWQIARV